MSTMTTLAYALWSASGLLLLFLGMIALYGILVLCVVLAAGHAPENPKRGQVPGPLAKKKGVRPLAAGSYPSPRTAKLSPY
jgi:hypothetical protein